MISDEYAETVADIVVDNGLAVVWSQRIDGDDPEAGKKARAGWNFAQPWPRGNRNGLIAHLKSYYGKRNLLVVTDASNVVTIDCDTLVGKSGYHSLGLPETLAVQSGRDGGGWHYIHRPPPELKRYTFFELAGDEMPKVTGAASKKLHVLAGIHKTGREYRIRGVDLSISPMTQEAYDTLVRGYERRVRKVRRDVTEGKLVSEPGRHEYLREQASTYYHYLGKRGELLEALIRAERDYACEPGPRVIDNREIRNIVRWVESRG